MKGVTMTKVLFAVILILIGATISLTWPGSHETSVRMVGDIKIITP
jgi:hypothetical protein